MSLHILDHQINSNVRLCANHSGVWQNTPPLDLAKVPGSKRNFWHTRAATKLSAKDSQISHLRQTFCSLSNPWQIFKLCCESRLGASDTHSWAKIYQQLSNQSSTWDHAHPIRSLGMWNCVQVLSDLTNLKSLINLKCNTIKGIDRVPKSPEFLPYSSQKSAAE